MLTDRVEPKIFSGTERMEVQLADLLAFYPDVSTPGFQKLFTAKKEFSELASSVRERPPRAGELYLYRHQELIKRILRAYDAQLVMHETGTGKTCSVVAFTEWVIEQYQRLHEGMKSGNIRQIIVLVPGRAQKAEFKYQLACRCAPGKYESSKSRKDISERNQKTNITNVIKKWYKIKTYQTFANEITTMYPTAKDNQGIIDEYSDSVFWIDEAHNLRIDPIPDSGAIREKQRTYHQIWRVLHLIQRSKVVISTATPAINNVNDIKPLMNLILPRDGVLPLDFQYKSMDPKHIRLLFPGLPEDVDPKRATREQMEPYFRIQMEKQVDLRTATLDDMRPFFQGRVSYVRALETGAIRENQVNPDIEPRESNSYEIHGVVYNFQTVLYETQMSDFQTEAYLRARSLRGGGGVTQSGIFGAERSASNFVFPDGNWGIGVSDEVAAKHRRDRLKRREERGNRDIVLANIDEGEEGQQDENLEEIPEPTVVRRAPRRKKGGKEASSKVPKGDEIVAGVWGKKGAIPTRKSTTTKKAFERYVITSDGGKTFRPSPELKPWLANMDRMGNLSCKFPEIVRLVKDEPGNAFVYEDQLQGSGLIVLGLCLEAQGFARFEESSSVFMSVDEETGGYCNKGGDRRTIRPNFPKALRYALLSGKTTDPERDAILETMNSNENVHGEYIKVLLCSSVGREGLNVNNVLQIHIVSPDWNDSNVHQAISRGLRSTSHVAILQEIARDLEKRGEDPSLAKVIVKVYQHAAFADDEYGSSIDEEMYQASEYKERQIRRVIRIVKRLAVDCWIHWGRNVRANDVPGTPACDYDTSNCGNRCKDRWVQWARRIGAPNAEEVAEQDFRDTCAYECADPLPRDEDYSTYDTYYAEEIMYSVNQDIKKIFRARSRVSIDEIEAFVPKYRRKYLEMTLAWIVANKTPVIDRFGFVSYVLEDMGTFYLTRDYPLGPSPPVSNAYYSQGLTALVEEPLSQVVSQFEEDFRDDALQEIEDLDPNTPDFDEIVDALPMESKALLLEGVLARFVRGESSPFIEAVMFKFRNVTFTMHEPVSQFKEVEQAAINKSRAGRKAKEGSKKRTRKVNISSVIKSGILNTIDRDTEVVYLHSLYTLVGGRTAYAVTAAFNKAEGRLRILKPSEWVKNQQSPWRDLSANETIVYNPLIQITILDRMKQYQIHGWYGTVLQDNQFRLAKPEEGESDGRLPKRGKVCKTANKIPLINIMWDIHFPLPSDADPSDDRAELIETLRAPLKKVKNLETWSLEKLQYYSVWINSDATREPLCDEILNFLADQGRVFFLFESVARNSAPVL